MRNIAAARLATEFHSNVKKLKIQRRMQRRKILRKLGPLWKSLIVQNLIKCHMLLEGSLFRNHIEVYLIIHRLQIISHRHMSLIEAVYLRLLKRS
uniref:Uncharacterized protein n=1 Tax=Lotus japonicus TaxID=34305 RepID=I3SHJ9_LOTJA|nr:unknown [Lotus japonicus]